MKCPACGSTRVFPSRARNLIERLRQNLTSTQPYRCHDCTWRKWGDVLIQPDTPDVHPEDLRTGRTPPPVSVADFDQLDAASRKP
jgi:hypothetical protein